MNKQAVYLISRIKIYLKELEHAIDTESEGFELTDKGYKELLEYEQWNRDNKLSI
jgi:hypothetical protein